MLSPRRAAALALVLACAGCTRFEGPRRLLEGHAADGAAARVAAVASGGETRPALLASARFETPLPRRPLLTFGAGLSWAGEGEPPGWFRVAVRAGGRTVWERTLNPRAARGWRDVSVPLEGLGGSTMLDFDLRLTDREGRPVEAPAGLLTGVSEPILHDLDAYGRARGIVLVSIDTLRRDHVGAYGYARPTTPRLDALAHQGLLCEDAVSTSSWTLPAHVSMLTSADPGVHGALDMRHGFDGRRSTLPELLRARGYATQAVTSHLYVSQVYGVNRGFDHLDFQQDRPATEVADRAIAILDRLGDRPFFLFLHFYDPHWHYAPPEAQRRLFARPYEGSVTGLWQDFSRRPREQITPADVQHLLDLYDGEIRYTDDELGRVLDHLRARGLDASTLVVVTSDHGEEFLEHGSWEHQKTLYEEVIRIPLLVRGPGVAVRREAAQVSLLDVAPTVLSWAGLDVPTGFGGASLLAPPGAREAYGETDHTDDGSRKLFLRSGARGGKAIFSLTSDGSRVLREEWYDLANGGETHPQAPRADTAAAFRQRALDRWRERNARGPGAPVELTPEQKERLRALGYVGP